MDQKAYSKYFKAFGDPTRLKILWLLSSKPLNVNEITAEIGLSQPTISRHLAILRDVGAVNDKREGQQVFYSLNHSSVQNCCSGFCDCLSIPVVIPTKKEEK
ncbi:MAG: metalloregulator ArsR/SmtB family transcription factor [bacterium]|nr:metalloregulator ArsR/SmtB family transcription factor [bacterium]